MSPASQCNWELRVEALWYRKIINTDLVQMFRTEQNDREDECNDIQIVLGFKRKKELKYYAILASLCC